MCLTDHEKEKMKLKKILEDCSNEFERYLTKRGFIQAKSFAAMAKSFTSFIIWNRNISDPHKITKGMANSQFRKDYRQTAYHENLSDSELKIGMKEYFTFLVYEKNLLPEKVLKWFQ